MPPQAATITVRVLRSPQEPGGTSAYQSWQVETFPRMSVLDALFAIQRDHDRTLSFRCSCRLGMCGTCAVIINNREGLACQTLVERFGGGEISVRPLNYLPVVKDLAVDMEPFFDRYRAVKPYFVPTAESAAAETTRVIKQGEGERKWVDPALGCISCGICFSSCSVVGFNAQFPGPAALNRAYTLANDVRDASREERLDLTGGENGVWRCHQMFNCASACPRHLVPTRAIRQLRVEAGATVENPLAAPLRWLRGKRLAALGDGGGGATSTGG
jgi:succinate dehydrogenase/fumarate reductase iron-sulfur protein